MTRKDDAYGARTMIQRRYHPGNASLIPHLLLEEPGLAAPLA